MLRAPDPDEYAPFHAAYIAMVTEGDVRHVLRRQVPELTAMLSGVPEDRAAAGYAPGKWSLKEMLLHVIDAERVFGYRLLRIARGDATPLPGFEQDDWVPHSGANARAMPELLLELAAVRAATILLVDSLADDAWVRRGVASGHTVSARALAYIIAGHVRHHQGIMRERYLA